MVSKAKTCNKGGVCMIDNRCMIKWSLVISLGMYL